MHCHDVGCFVHTFPLFHPVRWYTCHACLCHPLAFFASLHTCLHVHAWVLLANVSSMLQHNKAIDIRSKPTFVPRGHPHLFAFLLFFFFFAISFACWLAFLLLSHAVLAISILLIHFASFCYYLCIFSFHCLFFGFLILPLHVCIWSEDVQS